MSPSKAFFRLRPEALFPFPTKKVARSLLFLSCLMTQFSCENEQMRQFKNEQRTFAAANRHGGQRKVITANRSVAETIFYMSRRVNFNP